MELLLFYTKMFFKSLISTIGDSLQKRRKRRTFIDDDIDSDYE